MHPLVLLFSPPPFFQVVENHYRYKEDTCSICNTLAVAMLVQWLLTIPRTVQPWLAARLCHLCTTEAHNRQQCCSVGLLRVVVQVLAASQRLVYPTLTSKPSFMSTDCSITAVKALNMPQTNALVSDSLCTQVKCRQYVVEYNGTYTDSRSGQTIDSSPTSLACSLMSRRASTTFSKHPTSTNSSCAAG